MDKAEAVAIKQILAGNRDEYRVLLDRYFQAVFRVAFRITGNESDAEEAAQEAFLRGYNKLETFRQDASFPPGSLKSLGALRSISSNVERRTRDLSHQAPRVADPRAGCGAWCHGSCSRNALVSSVTSFNGKPKVSRGGGFIKSARMAPARRQANLRSSLRLLL